MFSYFWNHSKLKKKTFYNQSNSLFKIIIISGYVKCKEKSCKYLKTIPEYPSVCVTQIALPIPSIYDK